MKTTLKKKLLKLAIELIETICEDSTGQEEELLEGALSKLYFLKSELY